MTWFSAHEKTPRMLKDQGKFSTRVHAESISCGVGCHFLLQRIFPIQGSNPCLLHLLHWQADSLPLSCQTFSLLALHQHSLSKSAWSAVSLAPALVSSLRSCASIRFPGDSDPYTCENHRLIRFGAWGFVCLDARGPKRGVFSVGIWILVLVSVPGKRERRRKFSYMKRRITSLVTGNSGTIHECCFTWMTILFFRKGTFLWHDLLYSERLEYSIYSLLTSLVFPGGSEVKASACNAGDLGSIPGSGRSPGEGNSNPLQYSCLENPMDGGAW